MSRYVPSARERYVELCQEPAPRRPVDDGQAALEQVAALLDTTPAQLARRRRTRAIVRVRHEAMWLLERRGLSRSAIGRLLERDHSTVIHGLRRLAADAEAVARLAALAQGGAR
jgi:chromosomal replication initiation ATPase DnaA